MIVVSSWPLVGAGVVVAAALALTGCSAATRASGCERVTAVASFYPLQFLLERIGAGDVRVDVLTKPVAEPHDAELTARQAAELGDVDLVVYARGLQPAVNEAVAQMAAGRALDALGVVPGDSGSDAGHSDEHADAHEHAVSGTDVHFWLDPTKLAAVAEAVADRLAAVDESRRPAYEQRAAQLRRELERLDAQYRQGLDDCDRRVFVTSHEAFGHLARRYDLEQVGISGVSPEAEPSLARVRDVQRLAREHGVTTVFHESLGSPETATTIARDLGLRTALLDPVEAITDRSPGRDYFSVMRANLAALRKANGCS